MQPQTLKKRNLSNWTSFYTSAFQRFCCSGTVRKCLHCSWNPTQCYKHLYWCNHIELWLPLAEPQGSAESRLKNTVLHS